MHFHLNKTLTKAPFIDLQSNLPRVDNDLQKRILRAFLTVVKPARTKYDVSNVNKLAIVTKSSNGDALLQRRDMRRQKPLRHASAKSHRDIFERQIIRVGDASSS